MVKLPGFIRSAIDLTNGTGQCILRPPSASGSLFLLAAMGRRVVQVASVQISKLGIARSLPNSRISAPQQNELRRQDSHKRMCSRGQTPYSCRGKQKIAPYQVPSPMERANTMNHPIQV
jgi:hypothetical protein